MSHDLHEPLEDLVREVPRHVVRPDLARTAWAAGRRRRLRRRIAVTATAAAGVAVVLGLGPGVVDRVTTTPPAASTDGTIATGYPERIDKPWRLAELPDRPGPVAAVVDGGWEKRAWIAVSPTGKQWRIPVGAPGDDTYPTVSNTGRYLGYLAGFEGPYVIHDLVTGERTEFPDIGSGIDGTTARYTTYGQQPTFWSPDDSHLLVSGSATRRPFRGRGLVLGVDGSQRLVPDYEGHPAGWLAEDRIARVSWTETDDGFAEDAWVDVVDVEGDRLERVRLDLPRKAEVWMSQWSASVSPDGDQIAVRTDEDLAGADQVFRFSVADGRLRTTTQAADLDSTCQMSWSGATPVVTTLDPDDESGTAVLAAATPKPLVVTEPGASITCIMLAAAAAAGEPHGGLFGTSTASWTWKVQEIVLASAAGVALVLLWLRRRLRSR